MAECECCSVVGKLDLTWKQALELTHRQFRLPPHPMVYSHIDWRRRDASRRGHMVPAAQHRIEPGLRLPELFSSVVRRRILLPCPHGGVDRPSDLHLSPGQSPQFNVGLNVLKSVASWSRDRPPRPLTHEQENRNNRLFSIKCPGFG
jgi:hypothetical protein